MFHQRFVRERSQLCAHSRETFALANSKSLAGDHQCHYRRVSGQQRLWRQCPEDSNVHRDSTIIVGDPR